MDFLQYFGKDITLTILSNIHTLRDILSVLKVCKDWNRLIVEKKITNLVSDHLELFYRAMLHNHWNTIEHYVHDQNFMTNLQGNMGLITGLQHTIEVMSSIENVDEIIQWRNIARYIVDHYLDCRIRSIFYIAFAAIEPEEKEKVTVEWLYSVMNKHIPLGLPSDRGIFNLASEHNGYIKHSIETAILQSRNMTLIRSVFPLNCVPMEEYIWFIRYVNNDKDLEVLKYFILECTWLIPNFKDYIHHMIYFPNGLKVLAQCSHDRVVHPVSIGDMMKTTVKQYAPELIAWLEKNNARFGVNPNGFIFRKKESPLKIK